MLLGDPQGQEANRKEQDCSLPSPRAPPGAASWQSLIGAAGKTDAVGWPLPSASQLRLGGFGQLLNNCWIFPWTTLRPCLSHLRTCPFPSSSHGPCGLSSAFWQPCNASVSHIAIVTFPGGADGRVELQIELRNVHNMSSGA